MNIKPSFIVLLVFVPLCHVLFAENAIKDGVGDFIYKYKVGDKVKDVPVYYYAPKKLMPGSRIIFVIHNASRSAKGARDEWVKYVNQYKYLVVCPELSEKNFPGWYPFNGGNIWNKEEKRYSRKEEWSFNLIEQLFDFIRNDRDMKVEAYCIFGHSAGAQFVVRMAIFMPEARFSMAIANGAGSYTEPRYDEIFPLGLKGLSVTDDTLKKAFAKEVIICIGEKDFVSKQMPPSRDKLHEYDRVWEAKLFWKAMEKKADELGVKHNWTFKYIPGADHNNTKHALFGSRYASKSKKTLSESKDPNEMPVEQ